jgi:hypothetical protein
MKRPRTSPTTPCAAGVELLARQVAHLEEGGVVARRADAADGEVGGTGHVEHGLHGRVLDERVARLPAAQHGGRVQRVHPGAELRADLHERVVGVVAVGRQRQGAQHLHHGEALDRPVRERLRQQRQRRAPGHRQRAARLEQRHDVVGGGPGHVALDLLRARRAHRQHALQPVARLQLAGGLHVDRQRVVDPELHDAELLGLAQQPRHLHRGDAEALAISLWVRRSR